MPLPFSFDFKNPDYCKVFQWRIERLERIRKHPADLIGLKKYYQQNISQFIIDWGSTYDPRNVERGLPAVVPFLLFPRQEEWVQWFLERWKKQEYGLSDKSRDMGVSWMAVAVAVSACLFYDGVSVGIGSRKEEYVDRKDDLKSLLQKARMFLKYIPKEFRGSWDIAKHAPYRRILFPETDSIITGEAGDGIGRGDRTSFYIVDEAAWLPRPELVDASLSETTNCRIDISTPHGMANPFARKRFGGKISVCTLRWQDDPRKDLAWYAKKCDMLDDPVVIAQELDLDYSASVEGVLIPAAWVNAAIDAHIKLGINVTGIRTVGLDIADRGKDKNSFCGRHGILIEYLEQWSGKDDDIFGTVEKAFVLCDVLQYDQVFYDADGLGAGARGDARVINEKRAQKIDFRPFQGSGAVIDPSSDPFEAMGGSKDSVKSRTNEDFFGNRKAQEWWRLRQRFKKTYNAVVLQKPFNPDDLISIPTSIPHYRELITELSQPVYAQNNSGKIIVDKAPDGMASPNRADSVMIAFAKIKKPTWGFGSDEYLGSIS
jgi:hypothetical protein